MLWMKLIYPSHEEDREKHLESTHTSKKKRKTTLLGDWTDLLSITIKRTNQIFYNKVKPGSESCQGLPLV